MIIIIPFLLWTGKAEIKVEAPDLRTAIVEQVKAGADLRGADLRGANLYSANLYGADLRGADLYGANLRGANLRGADLYSANLYGANLYSANLYGADDEKLATMVESGRSYISIGPIGSRDDILQAFNTDKGIYIQTGCFGPKPLEEFAVAVSQTHGDSKFAKEYYLAMEIIKLAFAT